MRAFQTTRDVLGEELGLVPSPRLRRLEEQILLQDPDLDPPVAHQPESRWVENPYLGLRAFREADQSRFFGQDHLIERLVEPRRRRDAIHGARRSERLRKVERRAGRAHPASAP